jgi:hypothetical protein
MKRITLLAALTSIFTLLSFQSSYAVNQITLVAPSHRTLDGKFINDDLATALGYDGELGKLIFSPTPGPRIWIIDPALIDEVSSMATGYKLESNTVGEGETVAQIWLSRLKSISRFDPIIAAPYGSPSGYWIHRLDPHDESYFLSVGVAKLQTFFAKSVSLSATYLNNHWFKLPTSAIDSFTGAIQTIKATGSFMSPSDLEKYHLRIAAILNPTVNRNLREVLTKDIDANMAAINNKIRLASSKFTVTSQHQKLPITVINDFDNQATIKLDVEALNSKVSVPTSAQTITVTGKSKLQVFIPVSVVTSGQSVIQVTVKNAQGMALGDSVQYKLSLSVISPIATWFTSIAAIALFVGAVIQSLRRIRRKSSDE